MTLRPGDVGLSGIKAQALVSVAIKLGSVLRHERGAGMISRGLITALPLGAAIGGAYGATRPGGIADAPGDVAVIAAVAVLSALLGLVMALVTIVLIALLYASFSRDTPWFSHSWIVHHVDPDGTAWITEAESKGVVTRKLHYKPGDYVILRTSALLKGEDEAEMRAFLDAVTAARWKYDYGTFAGLAVYCVTGAFLAPAGVGTAICSGLTSEALTRGLAIWPLPAYRMMPQDQYDAAAAQGIEIVHT